jgi:hypothetical protein
LLDSSSGWACTVIKRRDSIMSSFLVLTPRWQSRSGLGRPGRCGTVGAVRHCPDPTDNFELEV